MEVRVSDVGDARVLSSLSKVFRPEVIVDEGRNKVSDELCQYLSEVCKTKASECREELISFKFIRVQSCVSVGV